MSVIRNIIEYLRDPISDEELLRPFREEQRQLAEYKRLRRKLPRLIRDFEATLNKLKELL